MTEISPAPTPHGRLSGRVLAMATLIVVATFAAYATLPLSGEYAKLGFGAGLFLLLGAVPGVWWLLDEVRDSERPLLDGLAAVSAIGSLAIVLPASIYVAMANGAPGSFEGLATKIDGLYFTVTIASTVGFGDIVPVSQAARLITTIHILTTVVVLGAVLRILTRLVGVRISTRHLEPSRSDPP